MKRDLDLWYELWDRAGSQGLDTWYDLRSEEQDGTDPEPTPDANAVCEKSKPEVRKGIS
jgi:hypothetical protein